MRNKSDVIIIGAGLTGLSLSYFLKDKNLSVQILEARNRVGGRIHTLREEGLAPMEMGATWLGKKHVKLVELLNELGLKVFKQELSDQAFYEPISTSPPMVVQLPPNNDPSFRIVDGTDKIIQTLTEKTEIQLGQKVFSIEKMEEGIIVTTDNGRFLASKVVSTLPPNLLFRNVKFTPNLPNDLNAIMKSTHTWMGESIKVGLYFKEPFWRSEGLSGTIFSNVGPIPEMYDHSNFEDNVFALKGFLNGNYYPLKKEDRKQMVLMQLRKYFGNKVDQFTKYEEKVWRNDELTFASYDEHILPHQNNGHQIYQKSLWNNQLFIAGSETAAQFPGYMDGAVWSAKFVADQITVNEKV